MTAHEGTSADPDTIAFYQAHAPHYTFTSAQRHSYQLDPFLDRLPKGARVLELGCGGGQDAARMKARGFVVDATDAVPAMVAKANERFGIGARVMAFHELAAVAEYDAVWAHASLLHAPRTALPDVIARIHRALRPGGWHFASYKLGESEGRDLLGRLHNFPSTDLLRQLYTVEGFEIIEFASFTAASSDGIDRDWAALTLEKP